ncbi:Protein CBG20403 [Caenorhabditis briggsae]|uniref:Protein CBG20403 n=1 Tax=Caenorhabditis briggsae TaxID=6238 RepID=A8XXP8_CAEBR|nr:Protein CBG20403 [Caenorhabditis briggsae]CAP37417.2 Protein CBG20403 [Caenorhabditis briggsae]
MSTLRSIISAPVTDIKKLSTDKMCHDIGYIFLVDNFLISFKRTEIIKFKVATSSSEVQASWGITCYEVFADGAEPFESISNAVVKADVLSSKFLQMPSNTPEAIKKYLNHFIFVEAARRASMSMAVGEFDRMAVMSENGTLEGGGAKQKLLKVFKKRHEKQSKGE